MANTKAMLMTEIRRESLVTVEEETGLMTTLAQSVKEVLGYDVLSKTVADKTELTRLQTALKELGIEVLNKQDVSQYQKERMIERSVELFRQWMIDTGKLTEIHSYNRFGGPSWTEQKISEYKQPVPEFVLAKAVQIKQAVPECEIYVEGLEDHPDPFLFVAIPDGRPYYAPKEKYYVEVWAEPKFEGKLRAQQDAVPMDSDPDFIPF